jgi:glutamate--cysteine ligase
VRKRGRLMLKGFDPCTILLNNDLSAGTPPQLMGLHEQYLLPPLHAGWTVRRKSQHFRAYEEVAKRFAKLLGMDPWLITPMSQSVDLRGKAPRPAGCGRRPAHQGAPQVQGIRHQREALRHHQERRGQLRPGVMTVRDAKDIETLAQRLPENLARKSSCRRACPRTSACTTRWPSRWST